MRGMRLIREMNNYNYMKIIKNLVHEYFGIVLETTDIKNTNAMYEDENDVIIVKFRFQSNPQSIFTWDCNFNFDTENSKMHYKCVSTKKTRGRADSFTTQQGEVVEGIKDCQNNNFKYIFGDVKNEIISAENKMW